MRATWVLGVMPLALASSLVHGQNRAEAPPAPQVQTKVSEPTRQESEAQYYRWTLGTMTSRNPGTSLPTPITPDMARAKMVTRLTLLIDDIDRRVILTDIQKKKLHAAGERDIQQFFDHLEQTKEKYLSALGDRAKVRESANDVSRLASDFKTAGLFDEQSFIFKVMESTLDKEQITKVRESRQIRLRSRWKTRAGLMSQVCGDAVGLNQNQRRQLSELIIAEIPPPTRVGRLDFFFIIFKLSQIPQAKVRPIFDDAQWKVLSRKLDQYRDSASDAMFIEWGYDLGEVKQAKPKPEPAK